MQAQRTQLFVFTPVFFAIGVGMYFGRTQEPERLADSFVLGGVFLCLSALSYFRSSKTYARFMAAFLFLMSMIAFGFFAADYRTDSVKTEMLKERVFGTMVTGVVTNFEQQEKAMRFYIAVEESDNPAIARLKNIRISHRGKLPNDFDAGDMVKVKVVLNPPSRPMYPGGYDFQRVAYFSQIGAVGYSISDVMIIERREGAFLFENMRQDLSRKIALVIPDKVNASIVNAFMTGEKKAIPKDVLENIRDSGLAHLLAISGLHVGFIAGIIFFLVRGGLAAIPYCALEWPIKKIAAFFALLGAAYFMMIVGAAVPTQRALIMTGLVLFAVLIDRTAISMRLVALAAFLILLFKPEELLNLSFQFSFAAVVALVGFYQGARSWLSHYYGRKGMVGRIALYFGGLAMTSLVAGLATAPFSLFYFNHFAFYGLLANMLAVPVMGIVVMPFVLLVYLFAPFGWETLLLILVDYGVSWIVGVADYTASLSGAVIHLPSWRGGAFICFIFAGLLLFLTKGKELKIISVVLIVLGVVMAMTTKKPDIIFDEKREIIAVRGSDGAYWFSNIRRNKFMTDMWKNQTMQDVKPFWTEEGSPVVCDDLGCVYTLKGKRIAFPLKQQAYYEDCQQSDFVIADTYFRKEFGCSPQQWFGLKEWKGQGVITLFYNQTDHQFDITSVRDVHGNRPWGASF